ncbi:MAG TPA: lysine--tRNA ligase [bacterium]|nr:lysine--tRNA ligase [bacterium]
MSDDLKENRRRKLEELRELGLDPYGGRFDRDADARDCRERYREERRVRVAGRLAAIRGHGKTVFADLWDETGKIQIYLRRDRLGDEVFEVVERLDLGDIVGVEGTLFTTRKGEISVMVESLAFLAKALLPLPEKWHGLKDVEQRYRQRYLDLIGNEAAREIFARRHKIVRAIRLFLWEKGFTEVETPMMQPLAGGAAAKPFVTRYEALDAPMFLRIAPELYLKRLLVGGMGKVFELNRNFRNEGLSRRHNPEFTMLEIYEAFGDCRSMMDLIEELVTTVAEEVCGTLRITQQESGETIDLSRPWRRVAYRDLVREYTGRPDWFDLGAEEAAREASARGLETEPGLSAPAVTHELYEKLVEPTLIQPTFVLRLPAELVPLARACADDPGVVDVFELEINGQEIAPGYSELNDPGEQLRRFRGQAGEGAGKGAIDFDFIEALEHGMPPAGGMGIGIDRLVMLLTGAPSIREVILFPQLRPRREEP